MGTLFKQKPRAKHLTSDRVLSQGENIKEIAKKLDISFNDALNLYMAVAKIDDYDAKDEQLSGFGKILNTIADDIAILANDIKGD